MTNISDTLCISAESISDFEALDLEIEAILDWAYVDDAVTRQRRIELANKLPLLVPMLVFDPDNPWSMDVAEQLDGGAPLLECLTEVFPTRSPESACALIGKPLALLGDWSDDVLGLILAVECLEVDELPETDAEWQIFSDFAKALHPCDTMLSGHVFKSLCRAGYLSSHEVVRDIAGSNPDGLSLINDYSRYLGRWYAWLLQYPASDRSGTADEKMSLPGVSEDCQTEADRLAESRLKQFSAVELLLQALRWDTAVRQASIEAQMYSDDPLLSQWPPLFVEPLTNGGYRILSMTSAADVTLECSRLHLDIESALSDCALGDSHIVALKSMEGVTQTLARIWISGPDAGRYLAYDSEHRGENGRHAYQAEVDALDISLKLFCEPEYQEWAAYLVDFHRARRLVVQQRIDSLPYRYDVMESVLGSVAPSLLLSI